MWRKSLFRHNRTASTNICIANNNLPQISLPRRNTLNECLYPHKKSDCQMQSLVRIKGLEPPRLSASDPKSDVATNYTISATLGFAP